MALFPDGRRQIYLALPGDLLDAPASDDLGLLHLALVPAQSADASALLPAMEKAPGSSLTRAWREARHAAEARHIRQILRLGRLTACERTASVSCGPAWPPA